MWFIFNFFCFPVLFIALVLPSEAEVSNSNKIDDIDVSVIIKNIAQENFTEYILGVGDVINIKFTDLDSFTGNYTISPEGTIYLPRLKSLYVVGLTISELTNYLSDEYKSYLIDPIIYIKPMYYRPIKVYVGGEVLRPGYYWYNMYNNNYKQTDNNFTQTDSNSVSVKTSTNSLNYNSIPIFPTVFDLIKLSGGVTTFSDLSNIEITRKMPISKGSGRKKTKIELLSLISIGEENNNIRLLDGDTVYINKSKIPLRDNLLSAAKANLNSKSISVFVSGNVNLPGKITLPQGSALSQSLAIADLKQFHGKLDFIRLNNDGSLDERTFKYNSKDRPGSTQNPILMTGDIIRVRGSKIISTLSTINLITAPLSNVYGSIKFLNMD